MSLLYSDWSDSNKNNTKKRQSTFGKPSKEHGFSDFNETKKSDENMHPAPTLSALDQTISENHARQQSVIESLMKGNGATSSSLEEEDVGDSLFLSPPVVNKNREPVDERYRSQTQQQTQQQQQQINTRLGAGFYQESAPSYGNYKSMYTDTNIKPYYAENKQDQFMEKINYMIHLLEQQQHEKTAHIGEEFVMYACVGVFVIYVVDSFSRVGKYTR